MQELPFLLRNFCVVAVLLCAVMTPALAQDAGPAPAAPLTSDNKGLLDELGRLLKAPADLLPSLSKSDPPKQEALPAVPASPQPAEAPAASTRLFPGMVTGRELCPRSENGAPDCQAGSDRLCRSKGYKSGKSLNTDSAFSCSVRQARAEGSKPCGNEHFVTSAFCN